jgi:regulator of sigma E protease
MDLISLGFEKFSFIWEVGVPFLAALTILVFVHELGHYMVARWYDVKIEVFSIGFGPELKGWDDKNGTRWKISAIPLGGYVKMFGESENVSGGGTGNQNERQMTPEEELVSFYHKSLMQRAAIVFAGPLINFLFAIIAFSALFGTVGVPEPVNKNPLAIIGNITVGGAADIGGLKPGDLIIQIDNEKIKYFSDLKRVIENIPNVKTTVVADRNGKKITLEVTTGSRIINDAAGEPAEYGLLGVSAKPGDVNYVRQNLTSAIILGFDRTYVFTVRILEYIRDIFIGRQAPDELGGILRIAQISGQVAELGVASFISFLAILSINLGLINLFPIPMLDGGHLAFYFIEAIRGRPLGPKAQEYGYRFGLVLVGSLFIFVTWNDLVYLKFFETIANFFI